jgi:hypothetical protein
MIIPIVSLTAELLQDCHGNRVKEGIEDEVGEIVFTYVSVGESNYPGG